jgi:hypothetical protein
MLIRLESIAGKKFFYSIIQHRLCEYSIRKKWNKSSEKWNWFSGETHSNRILPKNTSLSDNWKTCALGERIQIEGRDLKNIKELSPEAIKLGYDFSVALQERNNDLALEIIEKIEQLPTIWRDEL